MTTAAPSRPRSSAQQPAEPVAPRQFLWLVVLAAIWGGSFLLIKVAVTTLQPLWVSTGRLLFGGLALAVVVVGMALRQRVRGASDSSYVGGWLPRDPRAWLHNAVIGIVGCAIPFSLLAFAEARISSLLAGIWNATTPLFALPLAVLVFRTEQLTVRRLAGLITGLLGALIILGVWDMAAGPADLPGQLMCLGAAACYGISFGYTRRFVSRRSEPTAVAALVQMICGLVVLVPVALLTAGPPPPDDLTWQPLLAVVGLGAIGTGVAYLINLRNISIMGASTASTVTYLTPVFATTLGVAVLGERMTWHQPVGAVVVLLGVAIAQGLIGRRRRLRPVAGEEPR
ncbi:DMT family transporter [Microlunatus sp. Y2014]|uniref:DMT family transporter n=1 Tax=Microlunatus sp. Y2014 TaxID=3418488 RepID=UPI003DA7484D